MIWLTCISPLDDFTIDYLEKRKVHWLITEPQNTAVKHANTTLEMSCLTVRIIYDIVQSSGEVVYKQGIISGQSKQMSIKTQQL